MSFYKQKILRLKEFDDVEETVAYNTLGTVVHETLDELYKPIIGRFLTVDAMARSVAFFVLLSIDLCLTSFRIASLERSHPPQV